MDPSRRCILAGLIATLTGLLIALAGTHSGPATVARLLDEPPSPADTGSTAGLTVEAPPQRQTTADRKALETPPAGARRAERGPVLIAGRVIDDRGAPVEGATVTASTVIDRGDSPVYHVTGDLESIQRNTELRKRLREQSKLAVAMLDGGRFEVRGWTPAQRLHVAVRRGQQFVTRHYAVGTHGITVLVPRLGSVEAVVLHDPAVSARSLKLVLTGPGDVPPLALEPTRYTQPGKRTFEAEKVPVGTYTLDVGLRSHAGPLLRIDGLDVRADESCPDKRLRRIDTRGLCHKFIVKLMRPDGQSLPLPTCMSAEVTALDPNGDPLPIQPEVQQSRIELTTLYPYVDLRVRVRDYENVHLPVLSASCDVRLAPR